MTKFARIAALAAVATVFATPALAAPVAANPAAKARAKIVKPLTLTAERDLDFGTIVVGALGASQTVSVSQAGARSGCTGALTCSGTPQSARYLVTGTNQMTVTVAATGSNLVNTTSGGNETLAFTPDAPANVALGNSGAAGVQFFVGGSISIAPATVDGLYEGDINVTVDY